MALSLGLIFEAQEPESPRLRLLRDPLEARGDTVHGWCLPAEASGWARARFYARVLRELPSVGPLDAIAISGSSRALGLAAAVARLGGVELVLDVSVHDRARVAGVLDVLAGAAASRVVARDPVSYHALLKAGVPAYRAGLVRDPLVFAPIAARAKEPPAKGAIVVHVDARSMGDVTVALSAIEAALPSAPQLQAALFVPPSQLDVARARVAVLRSPVEVHAADAAAVARSRAHLALVLGEHADAAGAAMAVGVPLLWAVDEPPYGADGARQLPWADPARIGVELSALAKDRGARAELAARGRAWDDELGWPAQSRLWLRTVDAACAAKVLAERRARQAALEGVKTGTRKG